jgi:RHS repeat-associated protein
MRVRRSFSGSLLNFFSLLLVYTLTISLFSPFAIRRVEAAPTAKPEPQPTAAKEEKKGGRRDGEMLVRFRQGVSEQDKTRLVEGKGMKRAKRLRGRSRLEKLALKPGQDLDAVLTDLRSNPAIELAEPNYLVSRDEVVPDDPSFNDQWALRNTGATGGQAGADIQAVAAWETTTGAPGTVIAVIDSGIDFTHPDLQNNQWTNAAETADGNDNDNNGLADDLHGWDWVANSGTVVDENGHGTMIAGVIAAEGNNGAGTTGVMWHAGLMSLRVLDNTGTGDVASAVEAIDYAVDHEARVINCSWGTDQESVALKEAIQRAGTYGVVVVSSAGNSGKDIENAPYYPSSFGLSNQISVASTDNFDRLATWSNYGATHVTVAAPGVDILTTKMGGGYTTVTGTSASTALVTGVAGLIKAKQWWLSAAGTRAAIVDGARPVAELTGKVSAGGVVSASGALAAMQEPGPEPSPTPTPTPGGGTSGTTAGLPDLDAERDRVPEEPVAPAPIRADACTDCDPTGGDPTPVQGSSDPYFATARTRPQNETGEQGVDLGSRNFNWGLTLVSLPGRAGMDLNIGISYNSLVWTKQGTAIMFNADRGNPTAGFRLGLPTLEARYVSEDDPVGSYLLVLPSGQRVELKKVNTDAVTGNTTYESQDGSYIQAIDTGSTATNVVAKTTDGTQYFFNYTVNNYGLNCSRVQDRNGNYISIAYANNKVSQMVDTLGRAVNFNYNADGQISSITQPWAGGVTHTWATFGYAYQPISTIWSGLSYLGPQGSIPVLTQIGLDDGTLYKFDYTSWGQVWKIRHHAQDGHLLSYTGYNLPGSPWVASSAQTDCPRFTERHDWAEYWNGDTNSTPPTHPDTTEEAVTTYSVDTNSAGGGQPAWTKVTTPDGTVYTENFDTSATWKKGLTTGTEVKVGGVAVKTTTTTWTQDDQALAYQKNPRPLSTTITDSVGNARRLVFGYLGQTSFSLPTDVDEYKVVGTTETPLRRTHTNYNLATVYTSRRIIGLVSSKIVYSTVPGTSADIVSKVDYQYDEGGLWFDDPKTALTNHDTAFDGATYANRGNVTSVRRWDVPANYTDATKAIETNITYDTAGSVVRTTDPLQRVSEMDYTDSFSTAVSLALPTRAYPKTVTPPISTTENEALFVSTTQYNYDTGAVMKTTSPANSTGVAASDTATFADVTYLYDTARRLTKVTNVANGAYTRWVYATNNTLVQQYATVQSATEAYSAQVLDGAGQVRAAATDNPGGGGFTYSGPYIGQLFVYDQMGRLSQQSNPAEMTTGTGVPNATTSGWTPINDAPQTSTAWIFSRQEYDWKGRPTVSTNADGTTRTNSYAGCGCAGGEVVTTTDERGRQKKLSHDVLGRLVKVEELSNGTAFSTADYTYDAADRLTKISQGGQDRTFIYDGYGRLKSRLTPEQGTTAYTYYKDDTVATVTDPRGVVAAFAYNYRRQPTGITYTVPTGVEGLEPTTNVTLTYDSAGNRTTMTDGLGTAKYNYDSTSRLESEERTFAGLTDTYKLAYLYNRSGELTSVVASGTAGAGYAQQFGTSVQVGYTRDKTGRVTAVSGSGYAGVSSYVTGIKYRAWGAPAQINYSNTKSLTLGYDANLRLTNWDVSDHVLGWEYRYWTPALPENTGRVVFAANSNDPTLDRSYAYGEGGRLQASHSGNDASAHAGYDNWPAAGNGPYGQNYEYDQWGNMTWRNGEFMNDPQYSHDPQFNAKNQMTVNPLTGNPMTYDSAGNLTSDGGQQFTYDATGQQVKAKVGTAVILMQGYDGDGLRVKKDEGGVTTYYLRSSVLGGKVVAEIGGSGSYLGKMTRGYAYLGGQLLAVQEGREAGAARVLWVHQDPVTKSQRLTSNTGAVVSTVDLDPWGGETAKSSNQATQPQRYTSYLRDANGGDEAMFRRYESKLTRFAQPDPSDGSYDLTDPQSLNRYSYTQNDPVNFTDPMGLEINYADMYGAEHGWSDVMNGFWGPGDLIDRPHRRAYDSPEWGVCPPGTVCFTVEEFDGEGQLMNRYPVFFGFNDSFTAFWLKDRTPQDEKEIRRKYYEDCINRRADQRLADRQDRDNQIANNIIKSIIIGGAFGAFWGALGGIRFAPGVKIPPGVPGAIVGGAWGAGSAGFGAAVYEGTIGDWEFKKKQRLEVQADTHVCTAEADRFMSTLRK